MLYSPILAHSSLSYSARDKNKVKDSQDIFEMAKNNPIFRIGLKEMELKCEIWANTVGLLLAFLEMVWSFFFICDNMDGNIPDNWTNTIFLFPFTIFSSLMNMKIDMSLAMFGCPILILEHTIVYPGRYCSWICWGSQFGLWKTVSFWIFCTNLLSKIESVIQILLPISIFLSPVRDFLPYQQYKILQDSDKF